MQFISELPNIVRCVYDEEHQCTIHEWKSFFCTPEESIVMRSVLEEFLDFVQAHGVTKHIVDVKACIDTFREEDLEYITDYLVPKEIEYGILYLANVVADDLITRVTTEFWQEKVEGGMVIRNVQSIAEAIAWFEEKNEA